MNTTEFTLMGRYRLVISRDAECKDVVSEYDFPNLILDSGLELIGTVSTDFFNADIIKKFFVGSGTSTPTASQTSLDALIASTAENNTVVNSHTANYETGYMQSVFTRQFGMGVAAGNLSEIGVGVSSGSLFSRARILDGGGNPTTITVRPNEYLTVYYTLRCTIPQVDQTYSVTADIDGVLTPVSVIIRPSNASNAAPANWAFRTREVVSTLPTVSASDIVIPTGTPSGGLTFPTPSLVAYVPGSRQLFADYSIGINNGNVVGGIRSLVHRFGPGCWQMGFNPPLPKDNTKSISIRLGYSWTRA